MLLQIVVMTTLHGLEAEMQRGTFETINRLKNLAALVGDSAIIVGDPFQSAYFLRLTDEATGSPGVLYVSEDVKRLFYPNRSQIEIRAI